jgi:ubiquinone/menaquinone biosynthesis C-methylase UbiE
MTTATLTKPRPQSAAPKARQQATRAFGDYSAVGTTLQIVSERLYEAVDLRSTHKVLDVTAGTGNAALSAARRFAHVAASDHVGALLDRVRERAAAERLPVTFQVADAEALPFPEASFDIVLSSFGVMFAPDHAKAAGELARVCRPGGKIGLANWTPDGFIGRLLKVIGAHVPPLAGVRSPALWGTREHVDELFQGTADVMTGRRHFTFRHRSPADMIDFIRAAYGPLRRAFAGLGDAEAAALERAMLALVNEFNIARDGTVVVPGAYLEVVATCR